jgi:hypothetical protein
VVKRVEDEDCCFMASHTGIGVEYSWQDGVGDDEVEEGGLSGSRSMVGGWWRDEL